MDVDDDRTKDQRETHTYLVMGRSRFMSGWGRAKRGTSYVAWACATPEEATRVWRWATRHADVDDIRIVRDTPQHPVRPQGDGHFRVYVVVRGHPGLR